MKDKELIIGLGTGRCGTSSLSSFLNSQPNTYVIHEGDINGQRHLFDWNEDSKFVVSYLKKLLQKSNKNRVGDVASYFLPHVEDIINIYPNTKFIVLKRNRQETVRSFLNKTRERNHWMDHDGSKWNHDATWDPKFPTFDATSKQSAIKKYWDLYYHKIDKLRNNYPNSFSLHKMSDLNKKQERKKILSFLGYSSDEMVLSGTYYENTSSRNYITYLWSRIRSTIFEKLTS